MNNLINDLKSQSEVVVRNLTEQQGLSRVDAINLWYKSRTKRYLEENNLFFVSGMRCYIELMYEINKNP